MLHELRCCPTDDKVAFKRWKDHIIRMHWAKISPEDRWLLGSVVGGMVFLLFCMMGCLLCFDDAPAPTVVRQKVRRAFTAAEKAV